MIARRASRLGRYCERGVSWNRTHDTSAVDEIVRREPETARAILNGTEITRSHMTPEIRLFLLTPNCELYHAPFRDAFENNEANGYVFTDPFWSIYWPGGQAMARFILDEGKGLFSNCNGNILDLGAGCGAAAIAAKLVGAGRVVANDIDKGI